MSAVLATVPAVADAFHEGVAAHQEGEPEAALRSWTDAAEQGHFLAQYNLGILYLKGMGVPRSYSAAIRWFSRASRAGFAPAAVNLGLLFEKGFGVPMDSAIAWAHLSAGAEALSDGPCRAGAGERQARIAVGLDPAARVRAEKEARSLRERLWTESFLVPVGECFESVAYSGGKVQGLKVGTKRLVKSEAAAIHRERGEKKETASPRLDHQPTREPDDSALKSGNAWAYFVQMIALMREAPAKRELARLRKRHANLFGGTELILVKGGRAGAGSVYRVRAGPFRTRAAARGLCRGLREQGQDCFVVQSPVPQPSQSAN